jgi:hypothetical protein
VGLLDGDGSITVDQPQKWKSKLRIRIFISLNNNTENFNMLTLIKERICGRVRIERADKYVTWTCDKSTEFFKILSILKKYPLLTSRKQIQLNFALNCIEEPDIENFVYNRVNKYLNQKELCKMYNETFTIPDYFSGWLSGFIEGEGCFILRKNKRGVKHTKCFSIGQNNDEYIIKAIKTYFKSNNKIQVKKIALKDNYNWKYNNWGNYFKIELYGSLSRNIIYNHFIKYPLLGHKYISYSKWINNE